jgi:Single Cache domain 2
MIHNIARAALFGMVLAAGACDDHAQYGTAEQAKAMLERAVAAVKQDKDKALEMFNSPGGEFHDRDLYVFCANVSDAIETAHPTHKGKKLTDAKDANGFAFGEAIMNGAVEGEIREITYLWPRPGSDTPEEKVTYFTQVGDQVCAVGSYK